MNLQIIERTDAYVTIGWTDVPGADAYRVYWADRNTKGMVYKCLSETKDTQYRLSKATHIPHYFYVEALADGQVLETSERLKTSVKKVFHPQLEKLNRGLIAVPHKDGVFLSWRLFKNEVDGYSDTGLTGANFAVYRDGRAIGYVTDSTNFFDWNGHKDAEYQVAPVIQGK